MSEEKPKQLDYSLHLYRHGRLSGELVVTGIVNDCSDEGIEKRLLMYCRAIDGDTVRFDQTHGQIEKNIMQSLAEYGNIDTVLFHVESGFIKEDPFDYSERWPRADIALVHGNMGIVAADENMGSFTLTGEVLRTISPICNSYERQYVNARIEFSTMKKVENRRFLPFYWLCTRRVEKLRRIIREARPRGDLGEEIHYGKKLEWWTNLMHK